MSSVLKILTVSLLFVFTFQKSDRCALFNYIQKGACMSQKEELRVLINAFNRACQRLKIDEKSQGCLFIESINSTLKMAYGAYDGHQTDQVINAKNTMIEFLSFYRALSDFSGGDAAFMNHWLDVKNKSFGVPPRELLSTCEGIQRLNRYFDELDAIKY